MEWGEAVAGSLLATEAMSRTEAGGGTRAAWVESAGPETRLAFARAAEDPFL